MTRLGVDLGHSTIQAAPRRRRRTAVRSPLAVIVVSVGVLVAACGSGSSSTAAASDRPSTSAKLLITSPTANEVTGPDVTIQLSLTGARVVSTTSVGGGRLPSDMGHVHVSVDGLLVSMAFGLSQQLPHLAPGTHSLQAEFVAIDHKPFSNRVVAAVLFQVHP